jgi:iron complex outermembrane recepter protein
MDSRHHRPQGSSQIVLLAWARLNTHQTGTGQRTAGSPLFSLVVFCGLLWLVLLTRPAFAGPKLQQFHIDAGDATLTLNEFSRQSNLQLLFDYNIVRGRKTHPISGEFEAQEALKQMLADTGLEFDFINKRTLAVTLIDQEQKSGSAVATGPSTTPPARARSVEPQTVTHEGSGTGDPAADAKAPELEEVRITGTNLRGEPPVGEHVISLGREDDIEPSGAATVQDFLRTLPQTFGGGPTEDTRVGTEALTNSGLGAGINLRGLGAGATLVLINGRRLAPAGTQGEFVDIEAIPQSAVERIDVLPDSASALYGADAVGGVVNLIMRDNFSGVETLARYGSGTSDELGEAQFAQTLGKHWDSGNGMLSIEYYHRDALPASARAYGTSDLTAFGGSNFNSPYGNPGTLFVGPTPYAIPTAQNGAHLTAADLVAGTLNLQDRLLEADILPSQKHLSLYGSGKQEITDSIRAYGDVLLSHREATLQATGAQATLPVYSTNPFYVNPTGGTGPVTVDYDFLNDLGPEVNDSRVNTANITAGVEFDAGASWRLNLYANYARENEIEHTTGLVNFNALYAALADPNPATAFNPFGDGSNNNPSTVQAISASNRFYIDSQIRSADLATDGPIAHLPGGAVKLALGAEQREQLFSSLYPVTALNPIPPTDLSRHVTAAFGEITVPLFGKDNGAAGYRRLELSVAARYEHYSDFGAAATPKFGLLWSPLESTAFRGTWGRSISPPTLASLDQTANQVVTDPLPDASSHTGVTNTLVKAGGNSSLTVQSAKSWTTGLDFTPRVQIPGLSISLTYFDINFSDRIATPPVDANLLNDPGLAEFIIRNPTAAQIAAACGSGIYALGTIQQCLNSNPGAIFDARQQNIGSVRTRGLDVSAAWERSTDYGNIKLGFEGTYLFEFSQQATPTSPAESLLNTENNPVNLKLRTTAAWQRSRFGVTTGLNFQNSYRDTGSIPNRPVSAFATVDAQLRYELGSYDGGWLQNTRLELNAINLFNVSPPFLNNQAASLGYDQANADPLGRQLSLQIRKAW